MTAPQDTRQRPHSSPKKHNLNGFPRSDWLPLLQLLAAQVPALAPLVEEHLQIRLVIDANFVHRELQWRLKSRQQKNARTRLQEAVDSGVLVLFAPAHLEAEIREHLGEIAQRSKTTREQALIEWQAFRSKVHFYTPQKALRLKRGVPVVDPDDLPYIAACNELGAHAVYSKDKHFKTMSAPVISLAIDASLQRYARARTIQIGVMVGGVYSITLSAEAIATIIRMLFKQFQAFRKLHVAVQIAIVAALVILFSNPKLRARFSGIWEGIERLSMPLRENLTIAAGRVQAASITVGEMKKEIDSMIPSQRRPPALALARGICLAHNQPIPVIDLVAKMKAAGYRTKAKNFPAYLARTLRASGQFIETANGTFLLVDPITF